MAKRKIRYLEGQQFNNWLVLERAEDRVTKRGDKISYWKCQCQCDNKTEREVKEQSLLNNSTKSCGCYQKIAVKEAIARKADKVRNSDNFWLFDVGQEIETSCSTIKITKRIFNDGEYKKHRGKYYLYECLTCGYCCDLEHMVYENSIKNGHGCSICGGGNAVATGINDIHTLAPWIEKFFKDKNEVYNVSIGTRKKIITKCPDCGYEYPMCVANLYNQGFRCKRCSDGVSYPEKFMIAVLEQLNIDYIPQLNKTTFKWCENYKYDFYLPKYNYIIEVHGEQHYDRRGQFIYVSLPQQKETDRIKKELSLSNNISKYIIVDARKSTKDWLEEHINDAFNDIIDTSTVDYELCDKKALGNRVKEVCDYYMTHHNLSTGELGKIFKVASTTIGSYLKKGYQYGWCDYNPKIYFNKNYNYRSRQIEVWRNGEYLGVFKGVRELVIYAKERYNIKLYNSLVYKVLSGDRNHTQGFVCKYIN